MSETALARRTKDGREVKVEITEDGDVLVSGAKEIRAEFFFQETDRGIEIIPGTGGGTISAVLSLGGRTAVFHEGFEAILFLGEKPIAGVSPLYSLTLAKDDKEWKVDARDGRENWRQQFFFKKT